MPRPDRILETALYVDDLQRAHEFYETVIGLERILKSETLWAYDVGGRNVLLLFRRGASVSPQRLHGGLIPAHDGTGPLHLCFGTTEDELPAWEVKFDANGVVIEGRVSWPSGATSLYFRDPDGHMLELATRGLWPNY
ncbi:VOC family protein [Methylobacterium sp. R2-1]|uniref:VOC family protein n=1 Tax=Methylobacterium sp. R2-1 TaxID=2587064 RepID=UPI00161F4AD0|nr:VOC family protein [Methylobacterium sp. R2-1]MBB2959741.1 catechol 2,3-dioxygenase-like lactoylglutathione lyase family enzyme [Methylobacterium sp. R2-1]